MAWNTPGDQKKPQNPWGQGGGQKQEPPDLDEIFRRIKAQLQKWLGTKKLRPNNPFGSGGAQIKLGRGGNRMFTVIFLVILAIIVILWALSGIFVVQEPEQAVILQLGRYLETVGPGPHWIPTLIDTKNIVNEQAISTYSYSAEMLTKDENIVSVSIAVQYRIDNARDYLFNVTNPIESLQQATASALRQVIGQTTLDDILTVGREQVRQKVAEQLNRILSLYKTGIRITDVALQPARAPEQVKSAFDDAIKAQEDEQRYENQAQAYAMKVMATAKGQEQRMLADAKGYQQAVVLKAQGNVAGFLALLKEYRAAPQLMRERMYFDTMQSVLTHSRKILIDTNGSHNVLYLPLRQLMTQTENTTALDKERAENAENNVVNTTTLPMNDVKTPTIATTKSPTRTTNRLNAQGWGPTQQAQPSGYGPPEQGGY